MCASPGEAMAVAAAPGQPKVCELELALLVDEQVLRLEVAVKDAPVVAEGHATQQLQQRTPVPRAAGGAAPSKPGSQLPPRRLLRKGGMGWRVRRT